MSLKKTIFIKSFMNFNADIFIAMLMDFLGLLGLLAIFGLYYIYFNWIHILPLEYFGFLLFFIIGTLLALFLFTLNSAFFRWLVYRFATGSKAGFPTHMIFTLVWTLPWFLLYLFSFVVFSLDALPVIVPVFFMIYLIITSIARINMQMGLRQTFSRTMTVLTTIHKKIIAFLLVALCMLLLAVISAPFTYLNQSAYLFVSCLGLLFLSSWSRYYLSLVIK